MSSLKETKELIRKFALKNALDYGKAQEGAVISKLISADPSLKKDMRAVAEEVKSAVSEINKMKKEQLEKEFSRYEEEFKAADEEKAERSAKHSFHVEGAENGKFVTRFPPEPGGYMHLGHAKPLFIEDELRRIYGGKFMLYFDDTNAENEKQEFVDAFHSDLKWLNVKFDGEYYASDNLRMLYEYAEKAISKGKAYVCLCDGDTVKEGRASGVGCEHKKQSAKQNMELWKKMLADGFKDNEAILRLNSEMDAVNTTMRDPTLFRIKHTPHYRQGKKYWVWPTYDFCTPIMDSVKGITDALRSKEYELRDELYFAVLDMLELRKPRITSFSRLEIANNMTSKRKIRELIASGQIKGYDDPRLVTIIALRKRGIRPEAIREFALSFGMGKSESTGSLDTMLAMNRRIVDSEAARLCFMEDPVQMEIEGADKIDGEIKVRLNASEGSGYRSYKPGTALFINATDAKRFKKGDSLRLKDAFNVRIESIQKNKIKATYIGSEPISAPRVQWTGSMQSCELVQIGQLLVNDQFNKESITTVKGYTDGYVNDMEEGSYVQFDKVGYYKLDKKQGNLFISI